jgi:amino acid permease
MKHYLHAIATLIGTIIGAGVLGIPYVVAQAGFLSSLVTIIVLGIIVMFVFLYVGEIVLRTKGNHQMTGYCEKYLGKTGKVIMAVSMIIGIYGALIAYFIGESYTLSSIFGGNPFYYNIGFFILVSTIIYFGLKAVENSELVLSSIVLLIIFILVVLSFKHVNLNNLNHFSMSKMFLPYGVILFSYLGFVAVPEMKEELKGNLKSLKKAIIFGSLIPIVAYLLFSFVVVGVVGLDYFNSINPNERIATIALGNLLGQSMFLFGNLFAVFAMLTSFLTLALALKEMYIFDYKINKNVAWALTCIIPFVIGLLNVTDFIQIIAMTGVVAGGIDGILIVLMTMKAKKMGDRKPEYTIKMNWPIASFFILIFVSGALLHFLNII